MAPITRKLLIRIAKAKRNDARLLLKNGRWASAYYLFGVSVELAIKSVVATKMIAGVIPDKGFETVFYSHKLQSLY